MGTGISGPFEAFSLEHKLVKELVMSALLLCLTSREPGLTETTSKLMAKTEKPPVAGKVRQNVPVTSAALQTA